MSLEYTSLGFFLILLNQITLASVAFSTITLMNNDAGRILHDYALERPRLDRLFIGIWILQYHRTPKNQNN